MIPHIATVNFQREGEEKESANILSNKWEMTNMIGAEKWDELFMTFGHNDG